MFLKTFTELPVDFELVLAAVRQRPWDSLPGLALEAAERSQRMLVEVGLEIRGHPVSRSAQLEVGDPVTTEHVVSLPLRLEFEEDERLLPSFVGSLDAAWLGDGRTHLALSAQYEPPFGRLGRLADRALLHRVAEAMAHDFLEKVAARLLSELASNAGGKRSPDGVRPAPTPGSPALRPVTGGSFGPGRGPAEVRR